MVHVFIRSLYLGNCDGGTPRSRCLVLAYQVYSIYSIYIHLYQAIMISHVILCCYCQASIT